MRCRGQHVPPGQRRTHAVLVPGRQHAADHGHAQGSADLQSHGVGRRADPGVAPRDRSDHRVRRRRQQQAGAQADQQQAGQHVPVGRAATEELVETCHRPPAMAANPAQTVNRIRPARVTSGDNAALTARMSGHGQDAQPGPQGRIAEVELEELGRHEQPPQQTEDPEALRRQRHREPPIGEEAQLQHRVGAAVLPANEGGEHGQAGPAGPHHRP